MDTNALRRNLLIEEAKTLRVAIMKFRGEPMATGDDDYLNSLPDESLVFWVDGLRDICRSIGGLRGAK